MYFLRFYRLVLRVVYLLFFVVCSSVFFACEAEKEPAQVAPLSIEKTAQVMADHIFADAAAASAVPYTKDSLLRRYYAQILEIHDVQLSDYQLSIELYSAQDSAMLLVFNEVDSLLKIKKEEQ